MYKLKNIIKKYISENNINIVVDFFNKNNVKKLNFYNENIIPLNFYNKNIVNHMDFNHMNFNDMNFNDIISMQGGKDDSTYIDVYLDKNKYQIRLYKYTEKDDKKFKTINFIKIESELIDGEFSNGVHCAILIIDTKNKESNIQSLNNYKDCIKCYYENNKMYKIGDILVQVMIYMSIKKGMKKINLHDNSNFKCNGHNLPLIILRTITHGKPFYSKYGFLPLNHNKDDKNDKNDIYEYKKNELQIYEDNKKLFKSQPKMTKNELLQIIYYTKFDKNKDKNMLYYINHVIIPRLKNNNIVDEFVNNIINDSLIYQEQIKKYSKLNKNELCEIKDDILYLSASCELLDNILMVIFLKCGYYKYTEKTFELNLLNNKIIQDYKSKLKLKIKT